MRTPTRHEGVGWFADTDPEQDGEYQWQACLETRTGIVPSIDIWFRTREECEAWIRETIIGKGMLDT